MDYFLGILYIYFALGLFFNFYGRLARALPWELMKVVSVNDIETIPRWKIIALETCIRAGILTLYPYFLYDFWKRDRDEEALFTKMLKVKN
jgi:hypothetical protein